MDRLQVEICEYCKKKYKHYASRNKRFCSIECYGNWHKGINSATKGKSFVKGKHWKWNEDSRNKLIVWNKGKKIGSYPRSRIEPMLQKRNTRISKAQRRLFDVLKSKYSDAVLELKIDVNEGKNWRFLDVAIPSIKTCYEYDGKYWHQDKEKEEIRDKEIQREGWFIVHISENEFKGMFK